MTRILIDAATLISLGAVGRLDLLTCFDGQPVVYEAVASEVTTQPTRENLDRFTTDHDLPPVGLPAPDWLERARTLLGEQDVNGDVAIVAAVLAADGDIGVVSDDRRVRTVASGLGATVTETIGVVVRAVSEGLLTADEATALVRGLDRHGLHMTGELREKADALIEDAAAGRE